MSSAQFFNTSDVTTAGAWIQVAPQWALFVTVLAGGLWAVLTALRARRFEAIRWLQQMNADFYRNPQFNPIRSDLEHSYPQTVARVLQIQMIDGIPKLEKDAVGYAREIDNYLNYFENLLYMVEAGQIDPCDVDAMYHYWLSLFRRSEYGAVRAYAAAFGYERLARHLEAEPVRAICGSKIGVGAVDMGSGSCGHSIVVFEKAEDALVALREVKGKAAVSCTRHQTFHGADIDAGCLSSL